MSWYDPIIIGLRDINRTININWQEKRQLENELFDQSMKRMQLEMQISDPRRQAAIKQAQQQLEQAPIYLPSRDFDPETPGGQAEQQLNHDTLKTQMGYNGKVFRNAAGYAVDENGQLITDYGFRAKDIELQLLGKHTAMFVPGSDTSYRHDLQMLDNKIYNLKNSRGTNKLMKDGELYQLESERKKLVAKHNNPVNRMQTLREQRDYLQASLMKYNAIGFQKDFSDGIVKQIATINDEMNLILRQTGTKEKRSYKDIKVALYDKETGKRSGNVYTYMMDKDDQGFIDRETLVIGGRAISAPGHIWKEYQEEDKGGSSSESLTNQRFYNSVTDQIKKDTLKISILKDEDLIDVPASVVQEKLGDDAKPEEAAWLSGVLKGPDRERQINILRQKIQTSENILKRTQQDTGIPMWNWYVTDRSDFMKDTILKRLDDSDPLQKKLKEKLKSLESSPEILDYYQKYGIH